MSVFKDIVTLWNSDDLLSQAWDESYKMMVLSNEIFTQAIKYLREGENKDTIKALKKRDVEINTFQITTRAKKITENFNKLLENCGDCRNDDDIFPNKLNE